MFVTKGYGPIAGMRANEIALREREEPMGRMQNYTTNGIVAISYKSP